jgi:membrane-associated phospholipid phosphatase
LNVVMLVATPVIGAHYFVDVFGGIAVAVAAIMVAHAVSAQLADQVVRSGQPSALAPT